MAYSDNHLKTSRPGTHKVSGRTITTCFDHNMRHLPIYLLFLFLIIAAPLRGEAVTNENSPKYIVIHICALSTHHMKTEMEAGNLPNLEASFRDHGMIESAITYIPSKTPNVISNIRRGIPVEKSRSLSWSWVHKETGESASSTSVLMDMIRSVSRTAALNGFYGVPGSHLLSGIALSNLPELLDDYHVLEFYWFAVDTNGHLFGEENFLRKLRQFDKQFGKLMRRLDDEVNVIIYSDHGMVFEEGVRIEDKVKTMFGDRITVASYPNLYIDEPTQAKSTARTILEDTPVDFTFFKSDDSRVTGFHDHGRITIRKKEERFYYSYEGEDPFGYYALGYRGEGLTGDEWLYLTYDMEFPASPVSIYSYFFNPTSGDILMLFDESKFSRTGYSRSGNHGGFTYKDMSIPIFLRGPDLKHMYDRETLWLQDLFLEIDDVPFGHTPARDDHYLGWRYNPENNLSTMQVSISPYYRWRIGTEFDMDGAYDIDNYFFWGKFDLIRGFLIRLWIGAGVDARRQDIRAYGFIRHELRYRKLTARSKLSTAGNHSFALEYRLTSLLSIQLVNFNSAGLRLHF
jgi:hypothetical protein